MKYLHAMVRVFDLDAALDFFKLLGLKEIRRHERPQWECTLVLLATEEGEPEVELTYNWGQEEPNKGGRNFGHLAYHVDDIYEACSRLKDIGVTINRPPRDGHMAFVRSPDNVSIELLQKCSPLKPK